MNVNKQQAILDYTLSLADDALILGQRLSEWCGHGPVLEQDMAMTNQALDLIGRARSLYQYAGQLEGKGRGEDEWAYFRAAHEFRNLLLLEQPNGDFAHTIVRQFLYDAFSKPFYEALKHSKDEMLAAIAGKTVKEVTYHLRWSSEWMLRLGDGTELSHQKMQAALDDLWMYSGEALEMTEADKFLVKEGIAVDLAGIKPAWQQKIDETLQTANLQKPENSWMQKGGRSGSHSEYLGHILAEMQSLQRAMPGLEW